MLNSLSTTVATPRKWPGRAAPHRHVLQPVDLDVRAEAGRIHRPVSGWKIRVDAFAAADVQVLVERSRVAVKSSFGPNCVGLTKIDTTTKPVSARAARIRLAWPSCRAPIVGTSPTVSTGEGRRHSLRVSATVVVMGRRHERLPRLATSWLRFLRQQHLQI